MTKQSKLMVAAQLLVNCSSSPLIRIVQRKDCEPQKD
jgi:hypothetical protein